MIGGWIAAGLARLGLRPSPGLARGALRPGRSGEADVRSLLGEPEAVHEGEAGARILEYPRGPAGTETWMVEIGSDGRYRGMRNVLVEERFARLEHFNAHFDEGGRLTGVSRTPDPESINAQ